MTIPAMRRFLGTAVDADDRTLLGLPPAPAALTAANVQSAVAERIARVNRHPDRESADAAMVRGRVEQAGARLLHSLGRGPAATRPNGSPPRPVNGSAPRTAPMPPGGSAPLAGVQGAAASRGAEGETPAKPGDAPPQPPRGHPLAEVRRIAAGPIKPDPAARVAAPRRLTAFDRMVLAVLVANGGWNAESRARLVALAAQQGIGVDGLMRVMSGLAAHVRTSGARPNFAEMNEGVALLHAARHEAEPSRIEALLETVEERLGEELTSERLGPRIRVVAIFSLITLVMVYLLIRVLLVEPAPRQSPTSAETPAVADAGAGESPNTGVVPPSIDDATAPQPPTFAPGQVVLAKFPRPPGFAGERRPPEALQLLERARGLPALIDTLSRRITVGRDETSVAVEREWFAAAAEAGRCWPLMDPTLREAIAAQFALALRGVDAPTMGDRLLKAFEPAGVPREPMELWFAAFRAGVLARIVTHAALLPPGIVQRAGELLTQSLVVPVDGGVRGFADGAARWLDVAAPEMIARLRGNEAFADEWEAWIEAQRAVRGTEALQEALVRVLSLLMHSGNDLTEPGPPSDLMGRLVQMLDFTDAPAVRREVLAWFSDPKVSTESLWVLTSLMARERGVRWFGTDLVLDWSATEESRAAQAGRIASRWLEPTAVDEGIPRTIMASAEAIEAWREAVRAVEGAVPGLRDARSAMRVLILAAMLNEAAQAFEVGQERRAREIVEEIVAALPGATGVDATVQWPPGLNSSGIPRGVPSGVDGEWTAAFDATERSLDQRLAILRQLRTLPGGDLGPRDAETLVRAAFRGSSAEVRSVARAVLAESFRYGPTVVQELLDQLPESGATDELSEVIGAITETTLPRARDREWTRRARLALLLQLLRLRPVSESEVDLLAERLEDVMRRRLELMARNGSEPPDFGVGASLAIAQLVDGWRARAEATIAVAPFPAPLPELDRRRALRQRLASGSITGFVADQVSHLEYAALIFTATVPPLRAPIAEVIEDAALDRAAARSALEQSLLTELALTRLWEILLIGGRVEGVTAAPPGAIDPGRVPDGEMEPATDPEATPPADGTAPGRPIRSEPETRPAPPQIAPPGRPASRFPPRVRP